MQKPSAFRTGIPKGNTSEMIYILDVRTPLYSNTGLLLGYEGVWLDITRQSIAENRLTNSSWKQNLATITGGLVHDFSNIMTGIHSLSELYHDSLEPENPMYQGMEQIKKSSMQAQTLVRRIIDLNREDTSVRDYHNVQKLIKDQIELIRIILPKQIEINLDSNDEELPVYCDEVTFRQMLLNLAINARDAFKESQKGAVSISVIKKERGSHALENTIAGSYTTEKDSVEIVFNDNGCGIPDNNLSKIFTPFFTTKEATKGSGFGLYNAKLFVENNRGHKSI